jgi:hypothetical protein
MLLLIQDILTGKHALSHGGVRLIIDLTGGRKFELRLGPGVIDNLLQEIRSTIVAMDKAAAGSGGVSMVPMPVCVCVCVCVCDACG